MDGYTAAARVSGRLILKTDVRTMKQQPNKTYRFSTTRKCGTTMLLIIVAATDWPATSYQSSPNNEDVPVKARCNGCGSDFASLTCVH